MSRDQKPQIPLMLTMIVLIDQVSNLDEHLYLLLGIRKATKIRTRKIVGCTFRNPTTLIQNTYKAGKEMSTHAICPVDWGEISMKQSVGKCKQINF